MSWLAIAGISLGPTFGLLAVALTLFLCRQGGDIDYENLDFGTLRPPEPPAPIRYEFTE